MAMQETERRILNDITLSIQSRELYRKIRSTSYKSGKTNATNEWFAENMGISVRSVVRLMTELDGYGAISRATKPNGHGGKDRVITTPDIVVASKCIVSISEEPNLVKPKSQICLSETPAETPKTISEEPNLVKPKSQICLSEEPNLAYIASVSTSSLSFKKKGERKEEEKKIKESSARTPAEEVVAVPAPPYSEDIPSKGEEEGSEDVQGSEESLQNRAPQYRPSKEFIHFDTPKWESLLSAMSFDEDSKVACVATTFVQEFQKACRTAYPMCQFPALQGQVRIAQRLLTTLQGCGLRNEWIIRRWFKRWVLDSLEVEAQKCRNRNPHVSLKQFGWSWKKFKEDHIDRSHDEPAENIVTQLLEYRKNPLWR